MKRLFIICSIAFCFILFGCTQIILVPYTPETTPQDSPDEDPQDIPEKKTFNIISSDYNKIHIIVVASDYKNSTVRDLDSPINDAVELGACLESHCKDLDVDYEIHYMLSEGDSPNQSDPEYPTSTNVRSILENLETAEDDLVIFYYSGHAAYVDSDYTIIDNVYGNEDLYILAMAPTGPYSYTQLFSSDLNAIINSWNCKSIIILDAVYSAAIFNNQIIPDRTCYLASSNRFQASYCAPLARLEDGTLEAHGIFTAYLLKELGWNHSSEQYTETTVDGLVAAGYLDSSSETLDVISFWKNIEDQLALWHQTPQIGLSPTFQEFLTNQ